MAREEDEILDILGGEELVDIPELNIRTRARGDLAAFWDGYRDGRAGRPRIVNPPYDEPSVYRRAHARGSQFEKRVDVARNVCT